MIIEEGPSEKSKTVLKDMGLCSEHIDELFSLIHDAYGRFTLYEIGMEASQFSGDLDDDAIFNEAVKIFKDLNKL